MTMNRRIKCQSEGCPNEVLFKTHDGAFDDRRGSGGRSPLSPHDRHSTGPLQVSPYCKQHTCIHFYGDERCIYKKPPHDTVCAIHARCPVPNCYQARAQYLAPNFDPLSNAAPRYARYEVCSDHKCTIPRCPASRASSRTTFCQAHACQAEGCARQRQDQRNCCVEHQCKTRGCRTIVEGEFPHCAIHIKCQMSGCGESRHFSAKAKDYLAYCTNHSTCSFRRCTAIRIEGSPFCDVHTCRERACDKPTAAKPFCEDHCCAESACQNPRRWAPNTEHAGKYCPLHTCRSQKCHEYVDRLALFCGSHGCAKPKCHQEALAERLCIDHFKEHYIVQGKRQAHGRRHTNSRPDQNPKREDEQLHDALNNNIRPDTAGDSSDDETLESRPIAIAGSPLSALSQALRQNPPSYRGPSPTSYTKQTPPVEYATAAGGVKSVRGGGGGDGDGDGERPDMLVKIPETASNESGSTGRPIQGRRVEVEEANEDSEGWCGDT